MIFIFRLIMGFFNFQTPRTGGLLEKKIDFFGIFLTSMYRSSDLACSKHDFFHYQHPNERPGTDHVTSGPMRGLDKNCTNKQTSRQTDMATL